MDPISVYKRAVDQTGQIVAAVKNDQLDDATPCADWNVRALLNHTIAVAKAFGGSARGEAFDPAPFAEGVDNVGNDPGAAYAAAAKEIHEALGRPDVLEGTWSMPFGEVPAPMGVAFCTLELSQHGWDVAKATGQRANFDDEVSTVALETAKAAPAEVVRSPGVFGPESNCPESAPLHDQVAAFVGRHV
jgi:uncharacterized protein (TIGR03086 family)